MVEGGGVWLQWVPAREAISQLAFIAPSLQISPSRRRAGTHSAGGVGVSDGDTVAESDQTQVLVEAWVPACAGMARKGNSRIVTMFVEANWVTASKAGPTLRALSRRINGSRLSPGKRSGGGFIKGGSAARPVA